MDYNIAIDADSMVDVALSRTGTDKLNFLEEAYLEFCGQIKQVHSALFMKYGWHRGVSVNYVIALSPKKSWRNRLVKTYKKDRPERSPEKTMLLKLIWERLGDRVIANNEAEADDIVWYFANVLGWKIAAIDKDVKEVSLTDVYDYKARKWIAPKDKLSIERTVIAQSVKGDSTDGIKGAIGKGEAFCKENILNRREIPYREWVSWFASEEEAIESMRLVRMDQWTPEKGITLWTPDKWIM